MPFTQFLLPGESVLYQAPDDVYYRRTPFALFITGERLLLYAATGRLSSGERAVAEPLAGVESVEYSEGGFVSTRGRLEVRFPGHTLTLSGRPDTIKEVWRALQRHAATQGGAPADEEATIVSPPPPLFDDQPYPPMQVEPLYGAANNHSRPKASSLRRPAVVGLLFCFVALTATAGVLFWQRAHSPFTRPEPQPVQSAVAATPQPTPTPVTLHMMDEVFALEAGSHRAVKFTVPQGADEARVSGGFRVTSGSYVDVYLMRQEQYDRFAAGESPDVASVVYREAQWNARVGERLAPGDYYLVFDNRDSGDGAQTVAAEFFLTFDRPATAP